MPLLEAGKEESAPEYEISLACLLTAVPQQAPGHSWRLFDRVCRVGEGLAHSLASQLGGTASRCSLAWRDTFPWQMVTQPHSAGRDIRVALPAFLQLPLEQVASSVAMPSHLHLCWSTGKGEHHCPLCARATWKKVPYAVRMLLSLIMP